MLKEIIMFKHTIVRTPCSKICDGITSAPELGQPVYEKAVNAGLAPGPRMMYSNRQFVKKTDISKQLRKVLRYS
jgi:hypothetical protein